MHEMQFSTSAYFVTLTYNDESLPRDENDNPTVCKDDVQKFFKRLRKKFPHSNIRYFLNSEYGDQLSRPHYHACIFNLPDDVLLPSKDSEGKPLFTISGKGHEKAFINRKLNDIWQLGFVEFSPLIREQASYTAKYYINRIYEDELLTPNFSLMSRRPGIGFNKIADVSEKVHYYNLNCLFNDLGTKVKLPRYYKQRIFNDDELHERFAKFLDEREFGPEETTAQMDYKEAVLEASLHFKNKKRKI